MTKKRRVLLKDVADSLGVSPTLVSIVLNGKAKQYRIADEMAEKVTQAALEMNYSPNLIARNLRGGKTDLIGLVVTDISNPFYSSIARIIENRANELGYTVIFSSSDEKLDNTQRLINLLIYKGVDGLIVVPCDGSEELIESIHNNKTPLVLIDRDFPGSDLSSSCLNNYKATQLATEHLISQGFKNIALVGYETSMNHILDRIKGYEETMKKAGLSEYIEMQKIDLGRTREKMGSALEYLIKTQKVEAILFLTNMLAISGLYCLKEMHVRIPEDIAIVAFNRNDVFNLYSSTITHIRQPLDVIATRAVDILVDKIHQGTLEIHETSFAEPQLIIGESSRKRL